jgi:hypothetical protein
LFHARADTLADLQTTQLPSKRDVTGTVSLSFMWSLHAKHDNEKKDERWYVGV